MRLKHKEIFIEPSPGALVYGNTFYVRREGVEKMRTRIVETRDDLPDSLDISYSEDNGRTWSEWQPIESVFHTTEGVRRLRPQPGYVCPDSDRLITVVLEGLLPNDTPLDGMRHYFLRYRVSLDGGKTDVIDEQVVQEGDYTSEHPVDGVWIGRNSIMLGDLGSRPLTTTRGLILVPVQVTPVGPDGDYHNPGGGYTFHDSAVLIGECTDCLRIKWSISERIAGDPAKSTTGFAEPTVAEMPDGRLLMIMRGCNDVRPELPGYRWYSVSNDGGFHWAPPQPWRFVDGDTFYSPGSCSQLLPHSSGRYYWIGNITPENPRGSLPRYPLVIGEVDPNNLMLVKESVIVVDDKHPEDDPSLTLSNFMAHEDRENGDIILHMSRFNASCWTGVPFIYRIEI